MLRIAHLSDIHFGGEDAAAVDAAIAAVAAFAPALVVVTGDLTLNGLPREFLAAQGWLRRLPAPMIVTPGNHDTPYWNLVLRSLDPFGRYRRYIGKADTTGLERPEFVARTLNSARGAQPRLNWSKGALSIPELKRLDWRAGERERLRLFACHHPLIDLEGAPVSGGVHCGAEAAAILAAAGVDLVLTGHVHNPFVLPLTGSADGCYAIGAGTLSLRTRGTPAGFSTIVAEGAWIEVTVQDWTGAGFDAGRTWRLPRRAA